MLNWVEINEKALSSNLRHFQKILRRGVKLMPVIKANAYGHGFELIADFLGKNNDVTGVCVVNLDEACRLLKTGFKKEIIILSYFDLDDPNIAYAIRKKVIFPVYTAEQAKALSRSALETGRSARISLKIDTGASRLGILPNEVMKFTDFLNRVPSLKIESIFSHFADSEGNSVYTRKQTEAFKQAIESAAKQGTRISCRHIACSAAVVLYPEYYFDAVRLGLGFYGLYSSSKIRNKISLKPALAWNTKIVQLKTVPAKTKIGYGGSYVTKHPTRIAVIPVGYWDGFDRGLSNIGFVLINGHKCRVIGRVCMNISMVDTTLAGKIKTGDIVTLIGKQGKKMITADDMARWANTINYEVLDRINPLIPRISIRREL